MLSGVVGGVFLSSLTVQAAEILTKAPLANAPVPLYGPAVDGINGKLEGFGGAFDKRSFAGARGSISLPVQGQFGVQFDGAVGSFDSKGFARVAGHFFWRNPAQGLLGLYVSYNHWNQYGGQHVTHVGAEGQYYWGQWTIDALVGVESGNTVSAIFGTPATGLLIDTYTVRTRFFDQINFIYYPQENWKVYVGHRYLLGGHALALGAEYGIPMGAGNMAALFAEGRVGENNFTGIWGGLKMYLGQKDKSLIRRHREDDPPGDRDARRGTNSKTFIPHTECCLVGGNQVF
jgi:hypothetical protein